MKKILKIVLLTISNVSLAETPVELDTVEVIGNKSPLGVVNASTEVDDNEINDKYMYRSMPDALKYNPGIAIQQSGGQQQSPYFRSFTGYRTDLYIDGIRVNNGIEREGPNQYFGTFDPFTIGSLETTMGDSTVLYGSDAIGGTTNVRSRDGAAQLTSGQNYNVRSVQRYNTGDSSYISRYESAGRSGNVDWLFGASPKWYGNTIDGHGYSQPYTGYDEVDGDFKINFKINNNHSFTALYQRYSSNDAWRVHNTVYSTQFNGTQQGNLLRRSFDLSRDLGYLQYHGRDLGTWFADNVDVSFSVQNFNEPQNRASDGVVKSYLWSARGMSDTTIGSFIKASKDAGKLGIFDYGFETYQDNISAWNNETMPNGSLESTFGPVANGSKYGYTSLYIQNTYPLIKNKLDLISGGRYTYVTANVGPSEDPTSPGGTYAPFSRSFNFATGSGKLLWHMDDNGHYDSWYSISQGARAPTIFDFSGDELARSYELQTPNPNITPESFLTYETGFKTSFDNFTSGITFYYNDIQNMITRVPTGAIIDGDYQVVAKNGGHGHNEGIELNASYRFTPEWTTFGYFNWQDGQVTGYKLNDPTSQSMTTPSRLTPINGLIGTRYADQSNKWWIQTDIQLVASQDRLSYGDKFDTTRMPPNGTPGYVIANLRGGYEVSKNFSLSASVLNLNNEYYRSHGSGMNGQGISGMVQADIKF